MIFGMDRRCRRRTAADATVSPLTTAVRPDGQLPEEPVVKWLIRWNGPADTKCCPSCAKRHFAKLPERPLQEAAPPTAGRRQASHRIQADASSNPM